MNDEAALSDCGSCGCVVLLQHDLGPVPLNTLLIFLFLKAFILTKYPTILHLHLKWIGVTFRSLHTLRWKLDLLFHKFQCKFHVFFFSLTLQSVCSSDPSCSPGLADITMMAETTSLDTIRKYNAINSLWQTALRALMACGQEHYHHHGAKELTLVQVMIICSPLRDNWGQTF